MLLAALVIALAVAAALSMALYRARAACLAATRTLNDTRREMEILLRLSKDLEVARSYYAIQLAANAAIHDRLGMNNSWIFLAKPDDPDVMELLTFVGNAEEDVRTYTSILHVKGDAMMEEIVSSRRAVVVEDARTDPRTNKDFVEKEKICTLLNVSMRMADRLVGALGMGTYGDEGIRRFTPEEVAFTEALASRVAVALDRLRQFTLREKEQEARTVLATAMEQAGDGILVAGPDRKIVYINPAYEAFFGVSRVELIGKPLPAGHGITADPVQQSQVMFALERGEGWAGKLGVKREGREILLRATFSPVGKGIDGQPGGYVVVVRDITADEQLMRAKDYFVKVTSHEMRTPLTKLLLANKLLIKIAAEAGERGKEIHACETALSDAYQSFSRISETTSLVTEMSAARYTSYSRAPLFEVVSMAVAEARKEMADEGRKVTLAGNITLDASAKGDIAPAHLMRALSEALSNAVKYTPDGKAVTLHAFTRGSAAVIEVMDEGRGLTERELEDLFTPFFSPANTDRHSSGRYKYLGGGLGMGLTLMKLIMDHYGGTVTLERRAEGAGMKAVITVPLAV